MEKDYEMSSPGMRAFYFGTIAVYRNYVTFGQVQRALAEQMERMPLCESPTGSWATFFWKSIG